MSPKCLGKTVDGRDCTKMLTNKKYCKDHEDQDPDKGDAERQIIKKESMIITKENVFSKFQEFAQMRRDRKVLWDSLTGERIKLYRMTLNINKLQEKVDNHLLKEGEEKGAN